MLTDEQVDGLIGRIKNAFTWQRMDAEHVTIVARLDDDTMCRCMVHIVDVYAITRTVGDYHIWANDATVWLVSGETPHKLETCGVLDIVKVSPTE